jgi:hypothetical protein
METDELKNTIQDFAVKKWIDKGKMGVVESPNEGDKTFIFLKALYQMPKGDKKTIHLFLSDTADREREALKEIVKFDEIFNLDVLRDYNLQFFSYISVSNWQGREFGLVCCDNFHEQMTPGNFKFHLNNKYKALFGVTNYINKYQFCSIKTDALLSGYFNKLLVSKKEMLEKIAPVIFKYNMRGKYKAVEKPKKTLNIFVIKNKLDDRHMVVKSENATRIWYQTEKEAYGLITDSIKTISIKEPDEDVDSFEFEQVKSAEIKKLLNRRNQILHNLGSKKTLVEGILFRLRGRSMIFGNHVNSLEVLTPGRVLSMKNSDERNILIKKTFEKGTLRAISSYQDMKEVPSLELADNCILKDFYGSQEDFLKKVGNLREHCDKNGNVFIIVTEGTQEVVWFNEMVKDLSEHNYILCDNLIQTFNEYSKVEDF